MADSIRKVVVGIEPVETMVASPQRDAASDVYNQVAASISSNASALARVRLDPEAVRRAARLVALGDNPVICSGVGKSGFIMAKMAASLNSLGIRAVHLNPTDALHGDLGIVAAGSTAVLASNSGTTAEMVRLIPSLQSRGCVIVSIVGRSDSPLGRAATAVLDYGTVTEIDEHGLAPTTSTVVQLAVADALTAAASRLRGFTPHDFYVNHPAGTLGKRFLRVEALMRTADRVPTVTEDSLLSDVLTEMTARSIGCAAVIDGEGRLSGLLTDGDVRRAITQRVDLYAAHAGTIMQRSPQVARRGDLVESLMRKDGFFGRHFTVPVLDEGRQFLGMLVSIDLI